MNKPLLAACFSLVFSFFSHQLLAQWYPLGNYPDSAAFTDLILTTATDPSGNIYAAGQFTNSIGKYYVGKWDGTTWTALGGDSVFNATILSVVTDAAGNVYAAGYFGNSNGNTYVAKWDGSSWSELGGAGSSTFNLGIRALQFDGVGNLYAGGDFTNSMGAPYVAKWDGSSWSEVGGTNSSTFNGVIFSLAAGPNGNIYAAGQFYNNFFYYVAQWDGTSWSEVGGANNTHLMFQQFYGITALAVDSANNVYAGGDIVNADGKCYIAKWDGTSWGELGGAGSTPFFYSYNGVSCMKFDQAGNLYACGDFSDSSYYPFIAKWDGNSWTSVNGTVLPPSTGAYGYISIGLDHNGELFAAGDLRNGQGLNAVFKWDGSGWVELPTASPSIIKGMVFEMTKDANGNVYEVGYDYRDGVLLRRWDGTAWTIIGRESAPFNNTVYALTTDPSGNLYAGGFFTNGFPSGGSAYVAKYDGTSWSELGGAGTSNLNGYIQCLASDASGNIYTAGNFTNDPVWPNGSRYVAKWDGSSWSEVGGTGTSSFNNDIVTMAVGPNGHLYAAGAFTNANGKFYVAEWDGASWTELGGTNSSMFDSVIFKISIDGSGNVYAAGRFANGAGYKYVAKWDGTSWNEVGGINNATFANTISVITADYNGNVYAYDGTTNSDGNYIVWRWDGNSWGEAGGSNASPFNDRVACLITDGSGGLLAGGDFFLSGRGYRTSYIAKYDFYSGISSTTTGTLLEVYPNPVQDRFVFHATAQQIGSIYRIIDVFGKSVESGTIVSADNTVSSKGIAAGVYTVLIEGKHPAACKIIKQ